MLFLATSFSFGQKMGCSELITYRNTTLLGVYDREVNKHRVFSSHAQTCAVELAKLQGLGSEANWDLISSSLKTVGDQVSSTLSLLKLMGSMPKRAATIYRVYEGISQSKMALDAVFMEDVNQALLSAIESEVISAIPGLGNVYNMVNNVKSFQDYDRAKESIKSEIAKAQREIQKISDKLQQSSSRVNAINNYKNYIDDYLRKNCN